MVAAGSVGAVVAAGSVAAGSVVVAAGSVAIVSSVAAGSVDSVVVVVWPQAATPKARAAAAAAKPNLNFVIGSTPRLSVGVCPQRGRRFNAKDYPYWQAARESATMHICIALSAEVRSGAWALTAAPAPDRAVRTSVAWALASTAANFQ